MRFRDSRISRVEVRVVGRSFFEFLIGRWGFGLWKWRDVFGFGIIFKGKLIEFVD